MRGWSVRVAVLVALLVVVGSGFIGTAAATTTAPVCSEIGYTQNASGYYEVTNISQLQCIEDLIYDLYINPDDPIYYAALFGQTENSLITDVGLENVDIAGGFAASGIADVNGDGATIRRSYVTGEVAANGYDYSDAGGLVRSNSEGATIKESYADVDVESRRSTGGLVASNFGLVIDSYTLGDVTHTDGSGSAGGLIGSSFGPNQGNGIVRRSYTTGDVSGGTDDVGGLVGDNEGSVENSYWDVGTTTQTASVQNDGGTLSGVVVGFGEVSDTEPASEMQRFGPPVTMDALSFDNPR